MIITTPLVSLTVGQEKKIFVDPPQAVTWASDNANIAVDSNGVLLATTDFLRPNGKAIITATNQSGETATCEVTIVTWETGKMQLVLDKLLGYYHAVTEINGVVYFIDGGGQVWKYLDGAKTYIGLFLAYPSLWASVPPVDPILNTPNGYFVRRNELAGRIYKSTDFTNWSLSFESTYHGLMSGFSYAYDEVAKKVYVYAGEYIQDSNYRPKVYRGIIEEDGTETWSTVLEFFSQDEYAADPINNVPSAEHVHVVSVDPYTNEVWVGVGDSNTESALYRSTDNGDTFTKIGTGSQNWRSLSIWFTQDWVYWNMDAANDQSIWRIAKSNLSSHSLQNDLKELVVVLENGSMWYHIWAKDNLDEDIIIMAQASEWQQRDWRSRVFAIKEIGGAVDVQEIYSMLSSTPTVYNGFNQLEPLLQDSDGYIYLRTRYCSMDGILKMHLKYPLPKYKWLAPISYVVPYF